MFLNDLFKGKLGLVTTYWLWGVIGGALVTLGSYVAFYIAAKNIQNIFVYDLLTIGYSIFVSAWLVFIGLAIINSASFNRERGFWGWVASIIGTVSIIKGVYALLTVLGIVSFSWAEIEKGIAMESTALPIEIGEGLTLTKMSADSNNKSITYKFMFDYKTLNNKTFDTTIAKDAILTSCIDLKIYFDGPVTNIIYNYEANDGTEVDIKILKEDCGL